jgi:hypothetical protein
VARTPEQRSKVRIAPRAIAFLALLPLSVLVVRAQVALCSAQYQQLFEKYLSGELGTVFESRVLMRTLIPMVWAAAPTLWFPYQTNLFLQILFLWSGLIAFWAFCRQYLEPIESLGCCAVAALWLIWGMLPMGFSLAYPYDLPAFAFSALGMLILQRRDYWALVAVVLFGVLCKETLVWLVVAGLFVELRRDSQGFGRLRWLIVALVATGAYLAPRLALTWHSVRPAAFVTVDLIDDKVAGTPRWLSNLDELLRLRHGSLTENVYWYSLLYVAAVFVWKHLPPLLQSLWGGAVLLVVGNFFCGNIWEVRIFNEIVPLGAITTFLALKRCIPASEPAPTTSSNTS